MKQRFAVGWLMLVMVLAVISVGSVQADGIVVQPTGIAAVAPDGAGGVGLSVRLAALSDGRRGLWLDVAGVTSNLSDWGFFTGGSSEISLVEKWTKGLLPRGGIGYDWTNGTVLLYMTTEFGSAF